MAGILNVTPEQLKMLKPFLNKDGILEVVRREKDKKFKDFCKLIIKDTDKPQAQELAEKAFNLLKKNNLDMNKSIKMLSSITKLQGISLAFSGLNICATCAGFAIMYAKLDKISGQINELMNVIKQGNSVQANYEFSKVISEHSDMLDSRKRQKNYSEEQMRELVDAEYNVLKMLIETYSKNLTDDQEGLIFSMFSLASMLAVSLRYYDELYYYNNKEAIGDGDVWHASHDNWMSVFDKLLDDSIIARIQDYAFLNLKLSTRETDEFYLGMKEQLEDLVESVKDNQMIVSTLDNRDIMAVYDAYIKENVAESINEAFASDGDSQNSDILINAQKQVGLVA